MARSPEITPTSEQQNIMNFLREELMTTSSTTSKQGVTYRAGLNNEKNFFKKIGGSIQQAFASFKSPEKYKEVVEKRNQQTALSSADNLIVLINSYLEADGTLGSEKVTAHDVQMQIGKQINITETSGKSLTTGLLKGNGKENAMTDVCQQLADTLNSVFENTNLTVVRSKEDSVKAVINQMQSLRLRINSERGEDAIYKEQQAVDKKTMITRAVSGVVKYAGGAIAGLFTAGLGTSAAIGGIGGGMKGWANKTQQNESINQTFETDSKTGDVLIESFLERYGNISEVTNPSHYNIYNLYELFELKAIVEKLNENEDPSDPLSKKILPLKSSKALIELTKLTNFINVNYTTISTPLLGRLSVNEAAYKAHIESEDGYLEAQLNKIQVDIDNIKTPYLVKPTEEEKQEFLQTDDCRNLLIKIFNAEAANKSVGKIGSIIDKIKASDQSNKDFLEALIKINSSPEFEEYAEGLEKNYKGNAEFKNLQAKRNSQKGKVADGVMHVTEGVIAGLVGGTAVNKIKESFLGQNVIPFSNSTVPSNPSSVSSAPKFVEGIGDDQYFKVPVVKGKEIAKEYANVNQEGSYMKLMGKLKELGVNKGKVGTEDQLSAIRSEMKKHGGKVSNSFLKKLFKK